MISARQTSEAAPSFVIKKSSDVTNTSRHLRDNEEEEEEMKQKQREKEEEEEGRKWRWRRRKRRWMRENNTRRGEKRGGRGEGKEELGEKEKDD